MGSPPPVVIEGAAENNLRQVDVRLPAGFVALVGPSGSGKSSLAFDTLYHEARRRFLGALSLGSPWLRMPPARVRGITGLRPAVVVEQNTVNRNPNSTVATATGIHPFLRILFARFARRTCPGCGQEVTVLSSEQRLAAARSVVRSSVEPVEVLVPLVRGVEGAHMRLLEALEEHFDGDVLVDERPWDGRPLAEDRPHGIAVSLGRVPPDGGAAALRALLEEADALGSSVVELRDPTAASRTLSRAPVCHACARRLPVLRPADFRDPDERTDAYRLGEHTLGTLLGLPVAEAARVLAGADLPPAARRPLAEVERRLDALASVGLGFVTLDRPSPTLSRGEGQRLRLAVVLAQRVEDLIHVLDEPTIGLDPEQVGALVARLGRLRGPVVMVEHDRWAVAGADEVVELGPGAGAAGGRLVFQGTPAALWGADTPSGRAFGSRQQRAPAASRPPAEHSVVVSGASARNLAGFDCEFPVGHATVVTGPSGAGKTTLARDVLVASLESGAPTGCRALEGPELRPVTVDQSPIGKNPRSSPATYTKLADPLRRLFADATGQPASAFSYNRPEGSCGACQGMGALEVELQFLPSGWVTCDACEGRRFAPEILALRVPLGGSGEPLSIADVLELTVDEAAEVLQDVPAPARILSALQSLGLGYLTLGQPSPSLAGGEAQRVKLARQLAVTRPGDLVYLDEPTTGLHPVELSRLVAVVRDLTDQGCTVVVVEHNPDLLAAADWLVRLGPGGGPAGGRLIAQGPAADVAAAPRRARPRKQPRRRPRGAETITVKGAVANNLRDVSLELPKGAVTAVVGVSGSGKSSLVSDVLEAEATRRLLECLSMYERQSVREGPEAPVRALEGLGPTLSLGPQRRLWDPRSTVGSAGDLNAHLCLLFAALGERGCPACGGSQRRTRPTAQAPWRCTGCGREGPPADPQHFSPASFEAACPGCGGLGTVQEPRPERLIVRPEAPLCDGAMYSPGFFPGAYFCRAGNGGHAIVQALGARYGFDPAGTPWRDIGEDGRRAFLFGDPEPLDIELRTRQRTSRRTLTYKGFFPLLEGWDIGGLYTEHVACPECGGARLRPHYLDVTLAGWNRHELHQAPLSEVDARLGSLPDAEAARSRVAVPLSSVRKRLGFLGRVGLGYLHLDRRSSTLSAGEAQRVKLAALLGGDLTGLTVLLDEPSRGLHPSEVEALGDALVELSGRGCTLVVVEHDGALVRRADHAVVLGPGAGVAGGKVVADGPLPALARDPQAAALLHPPPLPAAGRRRRPVASWLCVRAPRENNLTGQDVRLPLGVLAGLCGVSGSGKSTLAADTLGLALAPPRLTTSVAHDRVEPGAHEGIEGAPGRTVVADQTRAGITSPGTFLGASSALRRWFAATDEARSAGLGERDLTPACDACHGRGAVRTDMGFLPAVGAPCDACDGTGYTAEVRELAVGDLTLPQTEALTVEEVLRRWPDDAGITRPLEVAADLGLGYLVLRQPGWTLSGGEAQRLKLVKELAKVRRQPTLYILDEPTLGLHTSDVRRLVDTLDRLVDAGHSVLVVEHDPNLLACCDWLVELGPGGPAGGAVVAEGTPEDVARGGTPTAPYLGAMLR